ncbi:MAG: hypothetical protein CSB13_04045 [Chloroflexi bacterium]|nr:MAG: hypothetical protein CSB13_04045 [Chloroflexota bacterium]
MPTSYLYPSPHNKKIMWGLLALIILIGIVLRLPYWRIIPSPGDELFQAVYSLRIANGVDYPLIGNDSYAGPIYFYFLAALIKLGLDGPLMGRVIAMITGVLTIPLTYLWVDALGKNKWAALISAFLVAINPYLIVVNSHMGGTTYFLPILAVLFLWCLAQTINRDNRSWLVAAAVAAGLLIQVNPVGALIALGGGLWAAYRTRKLPKLGKLWPLWPILWGVGVILVYSPVLIYNFGSGLDSVAVVQERSYLWESDPGVQTTLNNIRRLTLQLIRQQSGVLHGQEDFTTVLGIPLLYFLLSVWGFVFTTRRVSALPLLVTLPVLLLFPYFSSHYGFNVIARFTTMLIPVITAVIAFLFCHWLGKLSQQETRKRTGYTGGLMILSLALIIDPLILLKEYYDTSLAAGLNGKILLDITEEIVAQNQGEPVYLSTIEEIGSIEGGFTYLPHAAFVFADIHHEYLPPQQIIGRLYAQPGAASFLISHNDAAAIQQVAPLIADSSAANQAAMTQNYGFYTLDTSVSLTKPEFVLTEADLPPHLTPQATLSEHLALLGCTETAVIPATNQLQLSCYWQAVVPMPENTFVTFAHLIDNNSQALVTQDDHILGQERYPLNAWQTDEIIQETYHIPLTDLPKTDNYSLMLGVYTWPELTRLDIPDSADNVIELPAIQLHE